MRFEGVRQGGSILIVCQKHEDFASRQFLKPVTDRPFGMIAVKHPDQETLSQLLAIVWRKPDDAIPPFDLLKLVHR